jgi:hypothetical protein
MTEPSPRQPSHPIRAFFSGLRNVAEFVGEAVLAVIRVVTGRWPQTTVEARRRPKPPNQGLGPIEKIAPFPTDD